MDSPERRAYQPRPAATWQVCAESEGGPHAEATWVISPAQPQPEGPGAVRVGEKHRWQGLPGLV